MRRLTGAASLLAGLTLATQLAAGTGTPPPMSVTTGGDTTKAFVGLNWVFGSGPSKAEAIIGVAHGSNDASDHVTGGKAAIHFDLQDGLKFGKIKLTGLKGTNHVQAELGLGFNFLTNQIFGIGGINGSHFALGADVSFDGGTMGYAGIHTIGEFDKQTTTIILPTP